jgi:hypothetical protein
MLRRSFLGLGLSSLLIGIVGSAQTASAKNGGKKDIDGWVWHYAVQSGSKTESGQFRVRKYDVFKGGKQVGHIDPKGGHGLGDKSVIVFTDFGALNGTVVLKKTGMKPPTWSGTLIAKDRSRWQLRVKLASKK